MSAASLSSLLLMLAASSGLALTASAEKKYAQMHPPQADFGGRTASAGAEQSDNTSTEASSDVDGASLSLDSDLLVSMGSWS